MKIHLATDHAGLMHKIAVSEWLSSLGYEIDDHGSYEYDELDDFPDFISQAAQAVNDNEGDMGIIFGGSGQGEAMMANSYPKVRAVVYYGGDESIPVLSRQHNNSNILSIGARFVDVDTTKKVIWNWLHAEPNQDEKYQRRNKKMEDITNSLHS